MLQLTAAENLVQFDAVYFDANGKMAKALADSRDTTLAILLVKDSTISADAAGEFYPMGSVINNPAWIFDTGRWVYLSDAVPGGLSKNFPTTSGHSLWIMGVALSATSFLLFPSLIDVEVA